MSNIKGNPGPISFLNSKGDEIAVMRMDEQGNFEWKTHRKGEVSEKKRAWIEVSNREGLRSYSLLIAPIDYIYELEQQLEAAKEDERKAFEAGREQKSHTFVVAGLEYYTLKRKFESFDDYAKSREGK